MEHEMTVEKIQHEKDEIKDKLVSQLSDEIMGAKTYKKLAHKFHKLGMKTQAQEMINLAKIELSHHEVDLKVLWEMLTPEEKSEGNIFYKFFQNHMDWFHMVKEEVEDLIV